MTTLPLPLHRPPQLRLAPAEDPALTADLLVIADLVNRLDQAHSDLAVAVVRCRAGGASWRALGQALGVATKTVWNRYGGIDGAPVPAASAPLQRYT